MAAPEISVVIPVYNESGNIQPLVEEIHLALAHLSYETVIVDDASTDGTAVELIELVRQHNDVRV